MNIHEGKDTATVLLTSERDNLGPRHWPMWEDSADWWCTFHRRTWRQ